MLRMLLAFALLCLSYQDSISQETLREKMVGTWKLVSVESVRAGGEALHLWLGPNPVGLIIYLPNGFMSVQIMRDPRPKPFAKGRVLGTPDEFKDAYLGYYGYSGTYTVNEADKSVEHKIQTSLWPEEVGGTRKRAVILDGDKVTLITPPFRAELLIAREVLEKAGVRPDEMLTNRLTWVQVR